MTRALMTAATMYNDQRFLSKSELRIYKNKLRRKKIVRRQRLLLLILAAMILFGIIFLARSMSSSAIEADADILYKYYKPISVHAGDSLWSIASDNISYDKYDDIEAYITEVRNINHLEENEAIQAGEDIVIPYYSKEYK